MIWRSRSQLEQTVASSSRPAPRELPAYLEAALADSRALLARSSQCNPEAPRLDLHPDGSTSMVSHMKTTSIFQTTARQARDLAEDAGVTLKALVEEGCAE